MRKIAKDQLIPTFEELEAWFELHGEQEVGSLTDAYDDPISRYMARKLSDVVMIFDCAVAAKGCKEHVYLPNWAVRFLRCIRKKYEHSLNGQQALICLYLARITSTEPDPENYHIRPCGNVGHNWSRESDKICSNVVDLGRDEDDLVLTHVSRGYALSFVYEKRRG